MAEVSGTIVFLATERPFEMEAVRNLLAQIYQIDQQFDAVNGSVINASSEADAAKIAHLINEEYKRIAHERTTSPIQREIEEHYAEQMAIDAQRPRLTQYQKR